jgi:hypothetical protein
MAGEREAEEREKMWIRGHRGDGRREEGRGKKGGESRGWEV